jgi:hypothetical protein
MSRLWDYLHFLAWKAGLGYIALWCATFATLDHGPALFGGSGVCRPDAAKVLFYWVCDAESPLSIAAAVANTALTATVWAPVYVAAATVRPEAIVLAVPIVMTHLVGLPTAIFVTLRMLTGLLGLAKRRRTATVAMDAGRVPSRVAQATARRPAMPPRRAFGLRSTP